MERLIKYCKRNDIVFEQISEVTIQVNSKTYQLIFPNEEGKLFDTGGLIVSQYTEEDFYVFEFGGHYCYTPKGSEIDPKFIPFRYIGKSNNPSVPFLGVHTKYDILNGSDLVQWIEKAKFLNCDVLGICDKNTLAGTLPFQLLCEKNKIKSILGLNCTVVDNDDYRYGIKLFAKNESGWQNLLKINKEINIINNQFIYENELLKYLGDLAVIIDPKFTIFEKHKLYKGAFYQFEYCEFINDSVDKEYLLNFQKFLHSKIHPIWVSDAYYLDKSDSWIKELFNQVSGKKEYKSQSQFFQSIVDILKIKPLFGDTFVFDDNSFNSILQLAIKNLWDVVEECNFKISINNKFLPKYIMNKDEAEKYPDNESLFWGLINERLNSLNLSKEDYQKYTDRINTEVAVIKIGNLIDYFLINHDQIRWCKEQGILTGHGRGCFTKENKVLMSDFSLKNINEINIGDSVYNFFNKKSLVIDIFEYEIDEEIVELFFENNIIIKCTKDHKILTYNRGWVEAYFLEENDEICLVC